MSAEDPRKIMLSKKIRRPPRKMLAEDARGRCSRNMRTEYINSRPAANGCLQFRNIIILHISPYLSVLTCVLIPPSFSFCPYPSLLTGEGPLHVRHIDYRRGNSILIFYCYNLIYLWLLWNHHVVILQYWNEPQTVWALSRPRKAPAEDSRGRCLRKTSAEDPR